MPNANAETFQNKYNDICSKSKIFPLRSVIKHSEGTELCCPVEAIRMEHWPFVLEALKSDNSLTKIQFESNLSIASQQEPPVKKKKRIHKHYPLPFGCSPKNISQICKSLYHLVRSSDALTVLKIENVCLTKEDAMSLSLGLKFSKITHFSVAGCLLQDSSLQIICRNLSDAHVEWLDLSSCGLNLGGLTFVCRLIEIQKRERKAEMFPQTLRYQMPFLDEMKGLKRISMNNSNIGDVGVKLLMDCLEDDLWIKAFDLQKCFVGNGGAKLILDTLKSNAELQIIDLRQNDVDESYLEKISWQLSLNNAGKILKYNLGPLWEPRKVFRRFPRHKACLKTKVLKSTPPKSKSFSKNSSSVGKEILFSQDMISFKTLSTEDATCQTMNPELDSDDEDELTAAKSELNIVKKTLSNEIKLRECLMHLLKKYKMENSVLRKELEKLALLDDHILIDQETFSEVKNTFEKFKRFLDVMKEYGLFECIAMLGINENTDIVLKPMIVNATKKCMQLIENEPSVINEAELADSDLSNEPKVESSVPAKQVNYCNCQMPDCKSVKGKNGINGPKLPCSKGTFQETNHIKKSSSLDKTLVQRVFKEVQENYSNSSNSNHKICPLNIVARRPEIPVRKKPKTNPKTVVKTISKAQPQNLKLKNLKGSRELYNAVIKEGKQGDIVEVQKNSFLSSSLGALFSAEIKTVSSQMPSSPPVKNIAQKKVAEDSEKSKSTDNTSSTSNKNSSSDSSTFQESSTKDSDQSSVYKLSSSKPKLKKVSKKGKSHTSNSTISKLVTPNLSRVNSNSSENHSLSESVTSGSTVISESKTITDEMFSNRSNNKNNSYCDPSPIIFRKSGPLIKSLIVKGHKNPSKFGSGDNGRSESIEKYLESVSNESTDKDIKSLAESEVYTSGGSDKNSKSSLGKKVNQVVATVPDIPLSSSDGNSKSSKKKQTQKKTSSPNIIAKKTKKKDGSDSSVPSLSDITTVSSHSLNTDSVMGQLSES